MVLLGLLAPAATFRWRRNKSAKRGQSVAQQDGINASINGQLGLSRYGPQVMSVLCLCTSNIHQSTRNVTQTGKILPSPPLDTLCEQRVTPSQEIPTDELALLAKLEEANRLIESDAKSLNSLQSNHSRKGSDTSQVSVASGGSGGNGDAAPGRPNPADVEENTWSLWGHIVADWDYHWKKRKDSVKELVRQGIPHHFRGIVWQLLSGAHDSPVKKQFAEYIKATSACERIIRRDIARTYPEHDFFKEKDGLGQESLFNVMKAYSLHDREVGYCQGSGFIVGLLLLQQMPEEEAFAVLVALMQEYRLRDMYKPSMAELGVCMYQLEHLVADTHPELHAHFTVHGFHTSMYASSWFLTLFTTALRLPLACRIFDVFLSEGMEIIFKVALAMLHLGKEDLLSLDMEGMLKFFQKQLPGRAEKDPDGLMNLAYGMKIHPKRMKKLEKDYTILKMKEQEQMVEIRRLRAENKLLRQRTELLEAESSELADRLVKGQVSRAEEEETTFVVQRELAALRHKHLETSHRLEQAREEVRSLSLVLEQNALSRESSLDEILTRQEALALQEDMIQLLQDELVRVRLHDAENDALIKELRGRIQELEQDKKTLRESTPDNSVAHLQEELIAVKLREAEANLSLKDLRQRVLDLSAAWQRHLQDHRSAHLTAAADSTPKKLIFWENRSYDVQKLEEDIMTSRMREMEALAEVKELRLKVMELETQVQVATNQLRRQDEVGKVLKEELEAALAREKDLAVKLKEQQYKYSDLESKMKDEAMMARIRDAEHAQQVAELTQKISLLELKNEEMHAEGELRNNLDDSEKVRELQDKVAELKAEVMRLESWKQRWTGQTVRSFSVDTESELDERDLRICLQDHINTTTPNSPEV
ncbi:ecotropic viral integration site 5 ortholog isoform X1 [Harpegnathos saltator]|uniref:ecotropic viral integration site 5 ortholog isoform X1 n=2 Tax=Harpegnathos saltator TaxID=610380 RepID=UPI000948B72A|nr:ecotropic viral integration site 5 ortholog isoform X1 [Harpegnathos saltator]XP_025155931.1 ecotropic viral integration site 5 ortholog isoform X1 [Harpegnathos saltator]